MRAACRSYPPSAIDGAHVPSQLSTSPADFDSLRPRPLLSLSLPGAPLRRAIGLNYIKFFIIIIEASALTFSYRTLLQTSVSVQKSCVSPRFSFFFSFHTHPNLEINPGLKTIPVFERSSNLI